MLIQELLEEYGVKSLTGFDKHHREGWLQYQCPFCDSGKWHLGLHLISQYFNCWNCGFHKQYDTIKKLIPTITPDEIKKVIAGNAFRLEVRKNKNQNDTLTYPKGIKELSHFHLQYLKERRLNPDEIQELWGVKGIGQSGKLAWRLFIPVRDINGREVSWITRAINSFDRPAYIAAKAAESIISHKHILYGNEYVEGTAIVTEGPTDCWALGPGTVCTFGKNPSEEQLNQLRLIPRRIICFDPDGRNQSKNLCEFLSVFPGITEEVILDKKDPADMSKKERKELRELFF
jgi:hypothetical protein